MTQSERRAATLGGGLPETEPEELELLLVCVAAGAARRLRSGETGEPRSAKSLESGLSLVPSMQRSEWKRLERECDIVKRKGGTFGGKSLSDL